MTTLLKNGPWLLLVALLLLVSFRLVPAPSLLGTNSPIELQLRHSQATLGQDNTGVFEVYTIPYHPDVRYSLNGIDFQASGRFSGLQAGTYSVFARLDEQQTTTLDVHINVLQP